jgi:pyrophosphatase PpaX
MNHPVRCVLFDLDGTLLDSTELIFRSYQHTLTSELGAPATREELYLAFGQPLPEAFAAILDYRQVHRPDPERAALVQRLVATYRAFNFANHDALTRTFADVPAVLAELRRRGYPLGLVTSKGREIGQRGLRLAGIAEAFDVAVFQEDSARHKPRPDPLWVALERLGLRARPSEAVYVGDSTHDLVAGRAAGVQTAAALWGPFPRHRLTSLDPDFLLATIGDVLDLCPERDVHHRGTEDTENVKRET